MTHKKPYRLMIAISETAAAENWLRLALRMLPENGEILLRGRITIPQGSSLSEGARRAQHLRDKFAELISAYPMIQDEKWVRVDYDPFERIIREINESPVDLLLAEWHGPYQTTGGISTNSILEHAGCDVCLISGEAWKTDGPVLVTLRGGPNLTLGLQVARALTPSDQITLFHATDTTEEATRELHPLLGTEGGFSRVVTVRSDTDLKEQILRESAGHKAVIMGATFYKTSSSATASGEILGHVFDNAELPMVLIRKWHPEENNLHLPRYLPKREENVSTRVDRWFAENTFDSDEFENLRALMDMKDRQGVTVGLALPAYNEEDTVENVITIIRSALIENVPLLDEIVVMDGGSTDRTAEIVENCGVPLYKSPEILKDEVGFVAGKGEALWKSLYMLNTDIIAWIDTDIKNIHPRFVYGIIGPLLKHRHIQYVKGFYRRPIKVGESLQAYGGGRVTELVARPLLNLFYPELSGIIQPLAGEYAGRRTALERIPFFSGYGVETGMLLDLLDLFGLDAIAQTNLKQRIHHNQPLVNLSQMSFAILQVFIARLENRYGVHLLDHAHRSMKAIIENPERFALDIIEIEDKERPAMMDVSSYREKFGKPAK